MSGSTTSTCPPPPPAASWSSTRRPRTSSPPPSTRVALLLATARHIPAADASLRAGQWKRSKFSGVEINGKTVGVVGLGKIGQLFASALAAFGTAVIAYDPYVPPARAAQLGIELVDARRAAAPAPT